MTRSTGIQWIDTGRIAAQLRHAVPHRGEIDHRGHAGEILHQHARGTKADFRAGRAAIAKPMRKSFDIAALD